MHFVIAGSISCSQFTFAVMVAQRLKENLPDFTYLKVPKKPDEYKKWLITTCKENHWYHIQSPLIWREIGLKKAKKEFIGDVNKFLDLCYDYYGIPQDVLSAEQFNRGEIKWFTKRTESEYFENVKLNAKKRRDYRSRQVCITGASSQMTEIIVMELLQMDIQRRENGLEIRVFDEPTKEKRLKSLFMDARCCPGPSGFGNVRVTYTLKEALLNVDLVIVLDAFLRKNSETVVKWLKRNRNAMCALGKALNKYAPPHCRVILGGPSNQPLCYNATVLARFATNLHVRNIVAITQDLGRQTLKTLSTKTKIPLENFYCPPVWGFVGLNKFVDVRKTLQTYLYKVPSKSHKSTLPERKGEYELRTCENLLDEEEEGQLHKTVSSRKADIFPQLGRFPCLAKATAIIDLLKLWGLKQEDGNGEILSLGVYSDGTFNIPQGIYWSQPVILSNGFWVPFAEYPIPRTPYFNFYYFFMFSVVSLYRTKIKPRIYIPPRKKPKEKEKQKFEFDKIAEAIGMPVIRTDLECVSYLKYLTKTELGIDLDATKDYIEEEDEEEEEEPVIEMIPPPEVKKQIYCECWRQELKELQKVVFDHPSTTEVEVDLSENVSGSEWSIINAPTASQKGSKIKVPRAHSPRSRTDAKAVRTAGDAVGRYPHKKSSEQLGSVSSASTVCSCGPLSTGSVCKCLATSESGKEISGNKEKQFEEEKTDEEKSTEHYYKEQNATVFEEDLKDVIYEDTFVAEKHATFESGTKQEDGSGPLVKFYGQEDAAKDLESRSKMQDRISRYDQEGEMSFVEDEKTASVKAEGESEHSKSYTYSSDQDISDGTDSKEVSSHLQKESSEDIEGETALSVRTFPYSSEKSEEFLEIQGEDHIPGYCLPESQEEKSTEEYSVGSLDDLYGMWGESPPYDLFDKNEEEEAPKKRRKGIALCCLCRCLIPEGLNVCPCGETTVVEVFKQESYEIFVQNEDDVDYIVDYYDEKSSDVPGIGESEHISQPDLDFGDMFVEPESKKRDLPPESFFPFSSKPENRFREAVRPFELTKEYIDSLDKTENEIPLKCTQRKMKKSFVEIRDLMQGFSNLFEWKVSLECGAKYTPNGFLNTARKELKGSGLLGEEDKMFDYTEEAGEEGEKEVKPLLCEDLEQIKKEFSDLKMFTPCGLEDWRVTVQRKYREWFFQGPKIKDETFYDIAIEEVSEDEFEVDEELEKFFEN